MKKIFLILFTAATLCGVSQNQIANGEAGSSVRAKLNYIMGAVYNVKMYGLLGDGVTDDGPALNTLLNTTLASGSTIYFPPGTYLIHSTITINGKSFNMVGSYNATLTCNGNYQLFDIVNANEWVFDGLDFLATVTVGGGNQFALYMDANSAGFRICNCRFEGFNIGIFCAGINSILQVGGIILNCKFINNNFYAIDAAGSAEYLQIVGNSFEGNSTAVNLGGGNFLVSANDITSSVVGISVVSGPNNGHGIIANNNINHNTTSLNLASTAFGITLTGNNIFDGTIVIANTDKVIFTGGEISVSLISSDTNTNCFFSNVAFRAGYGNVFTLIAGTSPVFFACFADIPTGATNVFTF